MPEASQSERANGDGLTSCASTAGPAGPLTTAPQQSRPTDPWEEQVLGLVQQEANRLRHGRSRHRRLLILYGSIAAAYALFLCLPHVRAAFTWSARQTLVDTGYSVHPIPTYSSDRPVERVPIYGWGSQPPPDASATIMRPRSVTLRGLLAAVPWSLVLTIAGFSGLVFLGTLRALRAQKRAARNLAQLDVVRAVGPLAEALRIDDRNVRKVTEDALTGLLPRLRASDAGLLNREQRLNLCRALSGDNVDFVVAILKAFEHVGDGSEIDFVRRLADGEGRAARDERVREAAGECLPYLIMRAEKERMRQTLLRPASGPSTAEEALLRPAQGDGGGVTAALLRPAAQDDAA